MAMDFLEAVERLARKGACVQFISGNLLDPDIAAELFILDGLPDDLTRRRDAHSVSIGRALNSG